MYTEPERRISLKRLLLFAAAQGVGFAVVRTPNLVLPGDGDFAVQVFAPLSLAAVVLFAATPRLNLFFSAVVVAGSCFAYVAAYLLGVPVAAVTLLPIIDIGRVRWTLYHGVWCYLFLGAFVIACKLRGRLDISGWKDPR